MATFDWRRFIRDMELTVADFVIPQTDVIFLAATEPVLSSDLGVWDCIRGYGEPDIPTLLTARLLESIYKGRLVHIRHGEHGSPSFRCRQNHLKWIIYVRADIWCFAGIVRMLDGSSRCHHPVSAFERLQVLSLDIWPSTALYHFLAQ
jgi:hypothetical protein